jgi:hypothetical protein
MRARMLNSNQRGGLKPITGGGSSGGTPAPTPATSATPYGGNTGAGGVNMTPSPVSPAANTAGGAQYGPAMPAGGLSPSTGSLPARAAARRCCSAARARGTTSRRRPRARGPVGARVQFPAGTDDTTSDAREFLAPRHFWEKIGLASLEKRPSRISSSFGMRFALVPVPPKGELSGSCG